MKEFMKQIIEKAYRKIEAIVLKFNQTVSTEKRTHIDFGLIFGAAFFLLFILLSLNVWVWLVVVPVIVPIWLIARGIELFQRRVGGQLDKEDIRYTMFGGYYIQLLQVIYWVVIVF